MSVKKSYITVRGGGEAVLIEKKSKFISTVRPVSREEDAIAFLNEMRSKYSDATHNVYAYIIDENNIFRYSDDGEPSGTAGMPVLDTMRKAGIVDTAVVVTRYFGGTLLGTGGLVHAYGASANQGLAAAGIVTRVLCDIVSVTVDYTLTGKMQYKIASENILLDDTIYGNDVTFVLCLKTDETDNFIDQITDFTNGRAICKKTGSKYVDFDVIE